ncbi:hypothetical protein HPP92_007334 [Vanilla planifolia]|uniref:Uncharacterized protein n=1 Tax=Vanilla planifolia TaxID=51239 RepID=A0A835RLQ6_VANPL|nr:hypothetical protein HPP92_007334 [Vanilla planifolia]
MWTRACRGAKTLFFVANMLASLFLVCAPTLLIVLLDILIPFALLAGVNEPAFSVPSLTFQLRTFRFPVSLLDLPLLSIIRSVLILFFYLVWNRQGSYLGATTVCAAVSAGYVLAKAISMIRVDPIKGQRHLLNYGMKEGHTVEVLFLCSLALAMAHVVAAHRTNSRERRKLLVCKIDIEAVKVCLVQVAEEKSSRCSIDFLQRGWSVQFYCRCVGSIPLYIKGPV